MEESLGAGKNKKRKRERERKATKADGGRGRKRGERETRKLRAHSSLPASKWAGICSHGNGKGNRCERWLFRDETIVLYKRAREAGRG